MAFHSLTVSPADQAWMKKIGWTSARAIAKQVPPDIAAISRSSESFPLELDESSQAPPLVYLKRYWYLSLARQLRQVLRGSLFGWHRARYEYRFLEEMRRRGVQGARPIACGARRKAGMLVASMLITEAAPSCASLDRVAIAHLREKRMPSADRHALVESLAKSIRGMHAAGIKHGALFWRNIVVSPPSTITERITYIDPSTRGRFTRGALPTHDAHSDLVDFFASAFALDYRSDSARFMKAYLGKERLDRTDRTEIRRLMGAAIEIAEQERHRLAIADVLHYLRRRTTRAGDEAGPRVQAQSLGEFIEKLERSETIQCDYFAPSKTVQFDFAPGPGAANDQRGYFVIENGRFAYSKGMVAKPDLTIESDEATWLSLINGHKRAVSLIQKRKLRLKGDTMLAALLARHVGI